MRSHLNLQWTAEGGSNCWYIYQNKVHEDNILEQNSKLHCITSSDFQNGNCLIRTVCHPVIIHVMSQCFPPISPLLRRFNSFDEIVIQIVSIVSENIFWNVGFFRVNVVLHPNEVVKQTTSHDNVVLFCDWIKRWASENGPPGLEYAKCSLNGISSLGMFKVEIFFIVLRCHWAMTILLEMISDTPERG